MGSLEKTREDLEQEIRELREQLAEAQETLRAIREGEVDALVVSTPEGQRVFTLQSADQTYRTIIEQMQEGAVTLVEDGHINYSNQRFAEMVKRPLEEIIGSQFCEHLIEPDRGGVHQLLRQTHDGAARGELTLQAARWNLGPDPCGPGRGGPDGLSSISMVVTDLTERKRAEAVLASEQFVRAILNQAADGIVVCDTEGRLTFTNPAARRIAQLDTAETPVTTVSRLWRKVLDSQGRPIPVEEQSLPMALAGQVATAREKRVVRDDGSHYDILVSASPLRDADGQIIGAVATFTDISQRKRAEEAERQQREWLRVTLTSIGDAVIATDTAARVTFLNPVAAKLTGWTQEEAAGQPIGRVFPVINEKTRQPADDVVARVLRDKQVVALANDTVVVTKDGREVPVEDSAAPILDAGGNLVGVVLVFHDVTARRQAEEQIRRHVEELRASNEELARFNAAMVDRELRMVELKKEVNELCRRLGDPRPLSSRFHGGAAMSADNSSASNAELQAANEALRALACRRDQPHGRRPGRPAEGGRGRTGAARRAKSGSGWRSRPPMMQSGTST